MKNILVTATILAASAGVATLATRALGNSVSKDGAGNVAPKVLIIVSSEDQLPLKDGSTYQTGYYLNELSVPAKRLADAGYQLVFANPKGNRAPMDARSDDVKYFGGDQAKYAEIKAFHDSLTALQSPLKLADVIAGGLDQYAAVFFPGGHAPMIDLMASSEVGEILRAFHAAGKPTALICHGPIALAAVVADPAAFQQALIKGDLNAAQALANNWPYRGYQMTVFSTTEELLAQGHIGGQVQFFVESALQTAGGTVAVAQQWQSQVVADRELITGQNPFSDERLADALLAKLREKSRAN